MNWIKTLFWPKESVDKRTVVTANGRLNVIRITLVVMKSLVY